MSYTNLFRVGLLIILPSVVTQAQQHVEEEDSTTFFERLNTQYHTERAFQHKLYDNPASKSGYSTSSFTEAKVGYQTADESVYRPMLGHDQTSYGVSTNSFQTIRPDLHLWGAASYQNIEHKDMRWNENLDFDRISPYILADSVGGKMTVEKYQFLGGFSKSFHRFTIGLEGQYIAQMGARGRDPRNKTITSDLEVKFGVNYNPYKEFEIGAFVTGEKYTQNNTVRFASLLGFPNLYHMTGFGNYNYMFSGNSSSSNTQTLLEQFGYSFGGQITNRQGKDFYVLGQVGQQELIKSSNYFSSNYHDISKLVDDHYWVEGAKFFRFNAHRLGLQLTYQYDQRTGFEYGYSSNTETIEQLYLQKSYLRQVKNYKGSLYYQYTSPHFTVTAVPFLAYQNYSEQRIRPFSGQKWGALSYGIHTDFRLAFDEGHVLTIQPFVSRQNVSHAYQSFTLPSKVSMQDWINDDFAYLSSDVTHYGGSLRYDLKLSRFPGVFAGIRWENARIQQQNNTYTSFQLGFTF